MRLFTVSGGSGPDRLLLGLGAAASRRPYDAGLRVAQISMGHSRSFPDHDQRLKPPPPQAKPGDEKAGTAAGQSCPQQTEGALGDVSRAHAPHKAISPAHVLALVRGLVDAAADPRKDRYRYFKSLFGVELHEAAALRCGLVEHADGDLHVTAAGIDLYERHLCHLPDMAANYWHDQPHVTDAVTEINHAYDRATTDTDIP